MIGYDPAATQDMYDERDFQEEVFDVSGELRAKNDMTEDEAWALIHEMEQAFLSDIPF